MDVFLATAPLDMKIADKREREHEGARRILAMMLGHDASIGHDASGAPYVEGRRDLFISVSHCADTAAVAVSRDCPVGVDIERPSPRLERVVPRVMHSDEPQGIDPLRAWTAKEAVFKCAASPGMVLSDICLDATATMAVTPDGTRFAVCHTATGLALAVRLPKE